MVINAHSGGVSHIVAHRTSPLLLTSCQSASECTLWNLDETAFGDSEAKLHIPSCQHAIFNKAEDKIVATADSNAHVGAQSKANMQLNFV